MIALFTLPALAQICGDDTPAVVDGAVDALWHAYDIVDETAFDRAGKNLTAAVACLDREPAPAQVVRLHQAMALLSFVNGQTRACKRSLASARLMDPGWKLAEERFPESHPFRDLFASAVDPGPVEPIGRIAPDEWVVDGIERDEAPVERAFLLQVRQGDAIGWSGYVFSFEEIPDRGQARDRSALEVPHVWWLSAGLHGRLVAARQTADSVAWQDQSATAFGGGLSLLARGTPVSVVGFEAGGSLSGPGDPVEGGGGQPSAHAVVLLGGGGWVGAWQPYAAARLGGAVDRFRAWIGEEPDPQVWTVPSLSGGIEGGVRSARARGGFSADGLLASAKTPYEVRGRIDGGALVAGPLALEGVLDVRVGGLPFLDGNGAEVGSRRNTDVRVGFGVALWP